MHINRKRKCEVKNYVTETYDFCSFFLFFTTRFYHTFTELLEVTIYHFQTLCLCILTLTQTCSFQRICQQMKHLTKKSYMSKYCTCNYLFLNCILKYEISMTPIYYQFIVRIVGHIVFVWQINGKNTCLLNKLLSISYDNDLQQYPVYSMDLKYMYWYMYINDGTLY